MGQYMHVKYVFVWKREDRGGFNENKNRLFEKRNPVIGDGPLGLYFSLVGVPQK